MNVNYHAIFSINEYFKNQITEKVKKLDEFNLRFSDADVYFKLKDGTEVTSDKEFENAEINYISEPSEAAVEFILNYSKSLSFRQSEIVGSVFINLN